MKCVVTMANKTVPTGIDIVPPIAYWIVKAIDEKKIKININPNIWNKLELDDSEVDKRNLISKSINWCFYKNKNIFKTNLYKVKNDEEYVLLENMDINNYVEIIVNYRYKDGRIIEQKSKFLKEIFPQDVLDHYIHAAEWEQKDYDGSVNDWQLRRYFERG